MTRRIIYLKNPSTGSHFRTIGSGARSPKSKSAPKPGTTPNTGTGWNTPGNPNGYMPGYQTPSNWFVHTPEPSTPNYGSYDGPGVGPYEQEFTEFSQASTDLGFIYDMMMGIDPYTGNILAPYGTEGTMKFGVGTPWMDFAQEMEDTGFVPGNSQFFGWVAPSKAHAGNPWPELPSRYWGKNPKRNNPRPWWAK